MQNLKNSSLFILLIFVTATLSAQLVKGSFISDKTQRQLDKDSTLVPMSKGALFVPYILDSQREPMYTIFKDNQFVADAKPGRRVPLNPGSYRIYVGSGPLDNKIQIDVLIKEERVTVVKPVWSAIVVRVIDEFNNTTRDGYQIVDEKTKTTFGTGVGADETKGEKPNIWIVKSGLYRISKRGESPDSFKNFITVRTREDSVSFTILVFNEDNEFLGGGEITGEKEGVTEKNNWSFKGTLSGTFSLTSSINKPGVEDSSEYIVGAVTSSSLIYDSTDYLFLVKFDANERFSKKVTNESDEELFEPIRDDLRLNSTFIYRFNNWFGNYLWVQAMSRIFTIYKDYSNEDKNILVIENENSGNGRLLDKQKDFLFNDNFSPLTLQEGFGFNLEFKYGNIFSLTTRVGWGFKQDIAHKSYDESRDDNATEDTIEIYRVETITSQMGPEFSLLLSVMPFSFIEFKEDFISLVPVYGEEDIFYISETTITLWLSTYLNLQYLYQLKKEPYISIETQKYQELTAQVFLRIF